MKSSEFNIFLTLSSKTPRRSKIYFSRLIPLMIFASLFLLFSCEREDMYSVAQNKLEIGDTGPGGGIVFYVTSGGLHGLEVATLDLSVSQTFSTNISAFANGVSALPAGIGMGSSNTDAIIFQNSGGASAAKICRDYHGGNKSDWFLPSKDELNEIWVNLGANGIGGFTTGYYWSSSEDIANPNNAWDQGFGIGNQTNGIKTSNNSVRAVRSF